VASEARRIALLERSVGRAERRLRRAENRAHVFQARNKLESSRRGRRAAGALQRARDEYDQLSRQLAGARMSGAPSVPVPLAVPGGHAADGVAEKVSLSRAGFDALRRAGMSTTQAQRVLRRREAHGPFESIDELDQLPGFPPNQLAQIKQRVIP
jgi:competence protein ComEA